MIKIYTVNAYCSNKITSKLLVTFILLLCNWAEAQTCNPVGDQTSYGVDQWIGYVYTYPSADAAENPPINPFEEYKGYIIEPEIFNLDLGDAAISGDSICGTYADDFAIRFKMTKTLPEGYYLFTAGGDDGFRLSLDGGVTFPAAISIFNDHGYEPASLVYHHPGGVINFVLEYYENAGGATIDFTYHFMDCTSTAPTGIDGDTNVYSCNPQLELTATGGINGADSVYQWGTGTTIGLNVIAGQESETLTQTLSTTPAEYIYWVRRVAAYECSGPTDGVFTTVSVQNITPGDPSAFGDNVWNVYGYSGSDEVLANNTYKGYYTDEALSFNSESNFDELNSNPASAESWTGCTITSNDNFTFIAKRKGFDCGEYNLTVDKWDDEIWVYINNETTPAFHYNGYSGGAAGVITVPVPLGSYYLDADTQITVRVLEDAGEANGYLHITPVSVQPTSITGNNLICQGQSTTLTAIGGNPGTNGSYQWGIGTVGSNIIAGETSASITVSPTQDVTYWARIIFPSCNETEAAVRTVIINTNIWTGAANSDWNDAANWSCNMVPTDNDPIVIPAEPEKQPQVSGITAHAESIVVNTGAQLTVLSGGTLKVANAINVSGGGSLIVQNNASLLQDTGSAANTGTITVQKNSNPLYRLDYTMWSSPVSGQQIGAFSPITNPNHFYTYGGISDSAYADQYFKVTNLNASFDVATGYLIRMPNTITGGPTGTYFQGTSTLVYEGSFTGTPHNGTITKELNTLGNKYTAIGNPYPSPINVSEFFTQNAGILNADTGLYFWRKKNNGSVSSYATLTMAGFVANGATPTGSSTPTPGYVYGGQDQAVYYTGDSNQWLIATGQGFLVKADDNAIDPSIAFTNNMREASPGSNAIPFFKNGQFNPAVSRLWLNLSSAGGIFNQIAVAYIEGSTLGIDYGYDARKFIDEGLNLYTLANNTNLVIQSRPAFEPADVVPVGFSTTAPGVYTFTLDHTEGVFANGQDVYIKDNLMGKTQNITNSPYVFATDTGTYNNRFEIVYMEPLAVNNPVLSANNVIVYQQNGVINILTGSANMQSVTIYDMRGRIIYTKTGINATQATIADLQAQHEVLVLEISTAKGKVSKKMVF